MCGNEITLSVIVSGDLPMSQRLTSTSVLRPRRVYRRAGGKSSPKVASESSRGTTTPLLPQVAKCSTVNWNNRHAITGLQDVLEGMRQLISESVFAERGMISYDTQYFVEVNKLPPRRDLNKKTH